MTSLPFDIPVKLLFKLYCDMNPDLFIFRICDTGDGFRICMKKSQSEGIV